jgi:hypothetical protein
VSGIAVCAANEKHAAICAIRGFGLPKIAFILLGPFLCFVSFRPVKEMKNIKRAAAGGEPLTGWQWQLAGESGLPAFKVQGSKFPAFTKGMPGEKVEGSIGSLHTATEDCKLKIQRHFLISLQVEPASEHKDKKVQQGGIQGGDHDLKDHPADHKAVEHFPGNHFRDA